MDPEAGQDQTFTNFTLSHSRPTSKRKDAPTKSDINISKHLKQAGDALSSLVSSKYKSKPQDSQELYGQLLAQKLKRLSHRTQIILQNKIDNLVFEAELKEIDENTSVQFDSAGQFHIPEESYSSQQSIIVDVVTEDSPQMLFSTDNDK